MRELESTSEHFQKNKIEMQVQKKQQIEREFIGKIIPHRGHKVWEINLNTEEIQEAMYLQRDWNFVVNASTVDKNQEVLYREEYAYVSALNKQNAMKKYRQGKNGSKEVLLNPLTIKLF